MSIGRFGAVKLSDIQPELRADFFDLRGCLVDEYADFPDVFRNIGGEFSDLGCGDRAGLFS